MTRLAVAWTLLPLSAPPGSERGEEFGKSSPIALVVILLLGLATALLIRSMSKRLRNVPASFDAPADEAPAGEGDARRSDDPIDEGPTAAPSGRNPVDRPDGPPGTGSP